MVNSPFSRWCHVRVRSVTKLPFVLQRKLQSLTSGVSLDSIWWKTADTVLHWVFLGAWAMSAVCFGGCMATSVTGFWKGHQNFG